MDPVMAACVNMYRTNDHLLNKALDGLSDEDAWKHPGDGNPIYWIAGHMAVYRHSLAATLGVGSPLPWADVFKRTSQPDPSAKGPALSEIREALAAAAGPLTKRFAELTDADLSPAAPMKLPTQDPSVRGMISFFAYHESYHVGQIAYIKKWLGSPGIVDGQ
jgi:uncharacterized damage-inducible protein DinB